MSSGAIICLTACDEPAPEAPPRDVVAALTREQPLHERRWIEVKDKVSPARWLASREAKRDVAPDAPEVAVIGGLIAEADHRFTEAPRMIANRAVQVQEMLGERGVTISPRAVIEDLVTVAEGAEQERAGFGETCQHYVTSRLGGASREQAVAALRRQPLPTAQEGDGAP
ncbi:hypothetical protein JOD31_001780 [Methylopila capsulata]|uniref:MxaH protein n=1 Tax=Methylopila capsulata TaxID=61654 RepID=A0A9W6MQU2_9HYPH|nr:hypothetical protein [Methylopila capsulata]MBM7851555.1 hypothetical protein [Methylopila capsulata]GLK54613.1 hypothetical protein GCM10008170_06320 [Methylopila capsulata]